jgi:hypothetical protein
MLNMPRLETLMMFSLATSLFVSAAFAQSTNPARPGTVNYIEGQASLNGQVLTKQSVGSAELAPGQTISTTNGKAEVLLTPGVFLRLGENSAVTMVSPDLTKTEVQLDRGRAEVEVDQIFQQNDLLVDQGPAQAQLLQHGLYEFDASAGTVRVFDGRAAVSPSQDAKKWIVVKEHHQLALNGAPAKPQDFNAEQAANSDPLYSWSKLRADYLGQANLNLAEQYAGNPSFYPGWYWDSGLYAYTWLPGEGLLWSPFGYGFYSPYYLFGGGFIYPGYGFGVYRGGYPVHGPYFGGGAGFRGGFAGGGFHGGGGGRR